VTSAQTNTATMRARWEAVMMNNYGTPPVALASGEGAVVTDVDGKTYLDLLGGIAVNVLGHRHPAVIEAVTHQMSTLGHTSNLYATEPGIALQAFFDALGVPPREMIELGNKHGVPVAALVGAKEHALRQVDQYIGHIGRLVGQIDPADGIRAVFRFRKPGGFGVGHRRDADGHRGLQFL